jgi:hypothetical protein
VTAKIRTGYDDDRQLEDLAKRPIRRSDADRPRPEQAYQNEVDWSRIARRLVAIPVCGKRQDRPPPGSLTDAGGDRVRARDGQPGALADPWILRAAGERRGRRASSSSTSGSSSSAGRSRSLAPPDA